jgi:hypothetical protein
MRDYRRNHTYEAEQAIFTGTILGEAPGYATLETEALRILSSPNWIGTFGGFGITIDRLTDSPYAGLYRAATREVMFADHATRSTVAHELAHAAHRLSDGGGPAHGPQFRGWLVTLLRWGYGNEPEALMRTSFANLNLGIDEPVVPEIAIPAIVVDDRPQKVWV